MELSFARRELYGGAIEVELPTDIVDTSDLRQVPDHQEVFLRTTTLTSIIFEINEYQATATVPSATNNSESGAPVTNLDGSTNGTISISSDEAAAAYHLNDVIDAADHIAPDSVETMQVRLLQPSVANFPAYRSFATVYETEVVRRAPVDGQSSAPSQQQSESKCQQLLIRLKEYTTDLVVRINIPLKEFGDSQSEAALTEFGVGDQIMTKIIDTLNIKEFGLFGGGGE